MSKKSEKSTMTLAEAVDNLSSMAELSPAQIQEAREAMARGEAPLIEKREWLDLSDEKKTYSSVKESFKAIHSYLKAYSEDEALTGDVSAQRGIHAIMELAGEAASRIKTCSGLFQEAHDTEIKEYQDLRKFYLSKIVKKFHKSIESEEAWQEEWGDLPTGDAVDIERRGLKELEQVKRDRRYELFYILNEEGRPFFNRNLLRHIRLVVDFEELISGKEEEDVFAKINNEQDRIAQEGAASLRYACQKEISNHFQDGLKFKNQFMVLKANCASMAMMLASNTRNLLQHSTGRGCKRYFRDMVQYVRDFLGSMETIHHLQKARHEMESHLLAAFDLVQSVTFSLFTHRPKRDGLIGLIYNVILRGGGKKEEQASLESLSLWNALLEYHDSISHALRKYPSGPLMQMIDLFDSEEKKSFDPLAFQNYPCFLYRLHSDALNVNCLRLPSPTSQDSINHATLLPEFLSFMRTLEETDPPQKWLIFNLQDRTSWEEHARAQALEQAQVDLKENLLVVTLAKDTDFYHQTSEYIEGDDAGEFQLLLKNQIESGEECGFFFPKALDHKKLYEFCGDVIPLIHKLFFGEKESLTRKNRLDFIEIFYQFLILKVIEMVHPHYLSFTCKDALDKGAMQSVAFYSFIKALSADTTWHAEEKDFLVWMTFGPALLIRHRVVDNQRLSRTISALAVINAELEMNHNKAISECKSLYKSGAFGSIGCSEL